MASDPALCRPVVFGGFLGGSEPPAQWSPIRWFWWFSPVRGEPPTGHHLSSTKTSTHATPPENHPTGATR